MKTRLIFAILPVFIWSLLSAQEIPFAPLPDWESTPDGQIATGLGLADINGDGWKDIIVANGNDIQIQRLSVYYNQGDGSFPLLPDWESADIDYHGHLALGDINKDGWMDVAVSVYIGQGGFSQPGKVKVYYNLGGELESMPSFESYEFYTFSCALGDADGDGDLDLATTGGEPYSSLYDEGKIFINRNGYFSEYPEWTSNLTFGSLDVDFGDVDQNGYLDLIFASEETPNYIFLADNDGNISTDPSWQSAEPSNYINSVDFGLLGNSAFPGVVMTGNNQLGGDGKVRMYDFTGGVPASSSATWTSNAFGYGSGILLADVNLDGVNDLIYGGWWLPVKIALGDENGFELSTSYTSSTSSVVEAILMADLDRDGILTEQFNDTIPLNGISVIYLEHQIIENIINITLNGQTISPSFYTSVPNKNWISFKDPLQAGDVLQVDYEYSEKPDMVVTNWDSSIGNYIFYNQEISDIESTDYGPLESNLRIIPNPVNSELSVEILCEQQEDIAISLKNLSGQRVLPYQAHSFYKGTHTIILLMNQMSSGTYILEVNRAQGSQFRKVVKR